VSPPRDPDGDRSDFAASALAAPFISVRDADSAATDTEVNLEYSKSAEHPTGQASSDAFQMPASSAFLDPAPTLSSRFIDRFHELPLSLPFL